MPHSRDSQDELDDLAIQGLLSEDPTQKGKLDFLGRDLEPGEKASDAVDYEDIDDDDLPDEEDAGGGTSSGVSGALPHPEEVEAQDDLAGITQETLAPDSSNTVQDDDELEDLFGDIPSSPTDGHQGLDGEHGEDQNAVEVSPGFGDGVLTSSSTVLPDLPTAGEDLPSAAESLFRSINFGGQQDLIMPPAPPENPEEALAAMWPKFRRDNIPKFMELLPPKKARYIAKAPLKTPKPLPLTKVTLEVAPDQEKAFRLPGLAKPSKREMEKEAEDKGLVLIFDENADGGISDEGIELEEGYDHEVIGNITWNDIKLACQDWDEAIAREPSDSGTESAKRPLSEIEDPFADATDDWEREYGVQPSKKQKINHAEFNLKSMPTWELPPIDDPEHATAKIARKVVLDLNDPHLLIDYRQPDDAPKKAQLTNSNFKRGGNSKVTESVLQRYNISNDEAYDLLKENHQSKVRSTLGNLAVEHSVPALRLQYPYKYKVKLARQEARSFHRPAMSFVPNVPVRFSKPRTVKRKHLKGKDTQALFHSTKDLSLADNSNVLLLEYSEEYPTMMSNFGMGSRLVNYYRKKNLEDNARPKLDIGETAVLMPQDRSPFTLFGNIDPGETVPTLNNSLFRAPIFKQGVKPTDFLVIRNTTGVEGSSWYMRNIDHIYVVGQQFPAVDVPGPHSRKVTTASKNRLKMISYRKIKKNKPHRISIAEITKHFPETTDLQNRQKLKEFMQFNKEQKEWEMRPGESIPDEAAVRAMLKPEDVCLLEASQVGLQHLQDAGYGKDAEDSDEDDGKEGQSLEQQLAPWHTTRNFLNAQQGKAMLQLHGEGDPSGRGEAFSFIRTSMKGGFKALGESVEDKIDAKRLKELGGHSYNVARQQKAYEDSIRRIWEAQRQSLSSLVQHEDYDMDDEAADAPDDLFEEGITPRSEAILAPSLGHRGDDETTSQFSKFSTSSQRGKVLRITREHRKAGRLERGVEVVRDPRVIREYLKRRHALEAENMTLSELRPTGDAEQDRRAKKRLEEELARLERNKDRRLARDKQKGNFPDGTALSPSSPGSSSVSNNNKSAGTMRKCANCGLVGHIKTNKKLCPLLNGTMKHEGGAPQDGFGAMGAPTPL